MFMSPFPPLPTFSPADEGCWFEAINCVCCYRFQLLVFFVDYVYCYCLNRKH